MPILYIPLHYMQGWGRVWGGNGEGVGRGWGGGDEVVKVKRLYTYTIHVFPFEGCILYIHNIYV